MQITGVGHDAGPRSGRQRAQALQSGGHLHDVVRRVRQPAAVLLDDPVLPADQRSPPARAGVALAGAIVQTSTSPGAASGRWPGSTWIADAG